MDSFDRREPVFRVTRSEHRVLKVYLSEVATGGSDVIEFASETRDMGL